MPKYRDLCRLGTLKTWLSTASAFFRQDRCNSSLEGKKKRKIPKKIQMLPLPHPCSRHGYIDLLVLLIQ
jgi:hypothetical protein